MKPAVEQVKIAFVSDAIYPYHNGGKEKRIHEISTRLAQRGHSVHVYTMKWWKGSDVIMENGVYLHAICPLYDLYSGDRRSIKQGIMFGLACLKMIRENFDVVEVDHMPYFPLFSMKIVCLIKRKKFVGAWHEVWGRKYWRDYLGKLGVIAYLLERLTVFMPDLIVSISAHTTNRLSSVLKYHGMVRTISLGVDLEFINDTRPSDDKIDVVFVGRLLPHKKANVLLEAIDILRKDHSRIKCVINGEGPEKARLISIISKNGLENNVTLTGSISAESLYSMIRSSKVLVLPSVREGFGIVVIEAMACGVPVITTDHEDNAARFLIKDRFDGFLFNSSVEDLVKKIKIVIDDTSVNMGPACLATAQKYNWNYLVDKLEEAYLT